MAEDNTEDDKGRQIQPALSNESEDGTGTAHMLVTDSNGYLMVTAV